MLIQLSRFYGRSFEDTPAWRVLAYKRMMPVLQAQEDLRAIEAMQAADSFLPAKTRQKIIDRLNREAGEPATAEANPYAIRDALVAMGITKKDTPTNG